MRSGTTLTVTFGGGVPGLAYGIETTTSLTPPATWAPLNGTETFTADGNGNFGFTVSIAVPKRFYRARAQ